VALGIPWVAPLATKEAENESDDGWWETSTGAEFGRNRLNMLIELIENNSAKKCNIV
jgi:hypothetical protein